MSSTGAEGSVFDLPVERSAKAARPLIGADEEHLSVIRDALAETLAETESRLAEVRRLPAGSGQRAVERDLEARRLAARAHLLRRFGLDACLGRIEYADSREPMYIGRFGVSAADGCRLLVDWRAPAARPFFAATRAHPLGLSGRRRYRWSSGRVIDYWDERFGPTGDDASAALDAESAFIASLGATRSHRMRDVLATLQVDQDAIIRADSSGPLVVDGGPGTGKTVVALHRAAYLLYADRRLRAGAGRVLFIGPHQSYLAYIDDVLPSLGEDGALTGTLRDLVPEGERAVAETDPEIIRVKSEARLADAVEAAVGRWERLPTHPVPIDTSWGEIAIQPAEWTEAFDDVATMTHNDARDVAWTALVEVIAERVGLRLDREADRDGRWSEGWGEDGRAPGDLDGARWGIDEDGGFDAYGAGRDDAGSLRDILDDSPQLREAFDRAWPPLDPEAVVRGLLASPALLRRCAPWLDAADVEVLTRAEPARWTEADLPLLDAARLRVGDPHAEQQRAIMRAEAAESRRRMSEVVRELIATDDSEMHVMSMLRGQDMRGALDDTTAPPGDRFAGPFAHIVVDEAQELTDAQWRMLLRRCPSRSFTIVGDRAQARNGFRESWSERLQRVGLSDARVSGLTVNYRTPAEVMDTAAPVIRAVLPDANVPTSIRHTGIPVRHGQPAELEEILRRWLDTHETGTAAVIGVRHLPLPKGIPADRVRSMTPVLAKGLEFDLVVLVRPSAFGDTATAAVDRYVAMTRTTRELVLLDDGR